MIAVEGNLETIKPIDEYTEKMIADAIRYSFSIINIDWKKDELERLIKIKRKKDDR